MFGYSIYCIFLFSFTSDFSILLFALEANPRKSLKRTDLVNSAKKMVLYVNALQQHIQKEFKNIKQVV